eukprot:jgi/Undpi1/9704/HiC_scaffold_27.g12160.m1
MLPTPPPSVVVVPSPPVEGGAASQAGVNKPAARENWRPPSPPQPGETKYESSRTDVRRGGKGAKEDRVRGLEDILVGIEEREKIRGEKGRGEGRGGGGGEARWLGDEGASNRDRRAQDDGYRSFRDDGRVGGGRGDGDVYRRHARCDDRGSGGGGRGSDDRARNGSRNENERRGEGYGGPRRVGKSCPPPSAEKKGQHQTARDGGNAASSPEEGEDDELAAIMNKLSALDLDTGKTGRAGGEVEAALSGKNYLSLEEYKAAAASGKMKPYKGTKYLTVEHRYADGWAYNPTISRWIKIASQQKKNAIEAHPALVARLQMLENKVELSAKRSQLLETKAEKILKDKTTRPTVALTTLTAPELIVFDTNWLIHSLSDAKCLAADVASRRPSTSILIPKEVLRELDRLKMAGRDETLRYNAREANRYLLSLLEKPLASGRTFPVVRGQEDTDLYRDDGYHERPGQLRGDDSILNCCLFFTLGIKTPRKVTLHTADNNFAIRAKSNGLGTETRPQCIPGRCRMPFCPAPIRQSPFARGP